jgi:hypothetical protein
MSTERVSTTLALPAELLKAADQAIEAGKADNLDQLVANALKHELAALQKTTIDAEFAYMANDIEYQTEAHQIMAEFANADNEAFIIGQQFEAGEK